MKSAIGSMLVPAFVAAIATAPACPAAAPDTSEWKCERCPFARGHQADITAGSTYVSDDAASAGDATGYDEQGAYLNVDGSGLLATDGQRLKWRVEDLGLDSRVVELEGAGRGSYDYRLSYRELPRHRFDTTRTIFSRAPDNLLALPPVWTFAGTTSGFADLAASLAGRDIESERQTLAVGGGYRPVAKLRLFADFQRQEQDGTRIAGGSYFTNSSLLPVHFDRRTDQVDAGIRYELQSGYLELAYHGSFFDNRFAAVRWESPFLTLPGAGQGALAEAPDNDFQQLRLSGSWRIPVFDTGIAFSAALGRGSQDDTLLPYTTNAGLAAGPLPAATADAEVDTTNLALTVIAKPLSGTRVKFAIRYDERDNETPSLPWTRVIADSFLSGETEFNVPYGFERLRMNLSGEYQWSHGLRVSGGYDYTEVDREFQEVGEQTEDTGWGRVQWRPTGFLEITARGGVSRRNADFYDATLAAGNGQNPLLRKFNLAYRYRQFGELAISASPPAWPVTLSARAFLADDNYTSSTLGMTGSDEWRLAADLGWPVSDMAFLYVTAGIDDAESRQAGSAAFSAPDWQAKQSDRFYSLGGGFRITGIADKADLQFDYARGRGTTGIDVTGGAGGSTFPDLRSTLDSLRLRVLYHWSEKLEASVQLRYESFPTDDWALQDVAPDTLPTILTLGAEPYDDETWMAGFGFRYQLGDR